MAKKKILHVLRSDFGARHTMGIRSFHIFSDSPFDINVFCRMNSSSINNKIYSLPKYYYYLSRFFQLLRMLNAGFSFLQKFEKKYFIKKCKSTIKNADIIHFFDISYELLKYAKEENKMVVVEGFTNPISIQKMVDAGVSLDEKKFQPDKDLINSYVESDYILSPSDWVTFSMKESGIPSNKVIQIEYGVESYSVKSEFNEAVIKFVCAGGTKITKGIMEVLSAFIKLEGKINKKIELHIYGRMYYENKNEIDRLMSLSNSIYFHGFEENLNKIYSDKHIYLFPSYYEGSSKTVFEAMSFGMPIITTFQAGSIVKDQVNGFIVLMANADELYQKMLILTEDIELIKSMGKKSKELANEYTWKKYAGRVNSFYQTLND